MTIPRGTDYAVRALMDLAQRPGESPVQNAEIAARQSIPEAFLEQVLGSLRRAGLVRTVRGRGGGHRLAKPAEQITLQDIERAMEGEPPAGYCTMEQGECEMAGFCAFEQAWSAAANARREVLASITIADLVKRREEMYSADMYYI